jgi:hypothetical protein
LKTTINMFQSRKPSRQRAKLSAKSLIARLAAVFALAAVLVAYAAAYAQGKALDAAIDLQTQSAGSETETEPSAQALQARIDRYGIYDAQGEAAQNALAAAPGFDRGIFDMIDAARPAGVTIQGLSVADNVISILCVTSGNRPPADYAEALDRLPAFESVEYTGFQEAGEDAYSFTLTCVLPPSAGGDGL